MTHVCWISDIRRVQSQSGVENYVRSTHCPCGNSRIPVSLTVPEQSLFYRRVPPGPRRFLRGSSYCSELVAKKLADSYPKIIRVLINIQSILVTEHIHQVLGCCQRLVGPFFRQAASGIAVQVLSLRYLRSQLTH